MSFILIDKPKGITSHDVIDELRKITGVRKIGHAGTLDPNATGLLIVGIGRESTKKLGDLTKNTKKTYEAEICLGEERETDDAEGVVVGKRVPRQVHSSHVVNLSRDDKVGMKSLPTLSKTNVVKVLKGFIGQQMQLPPAYSAIKIKGKKAYQLARKGKNIRLKPRKITIYSIKLLSYMFPVLSIKCSVSSGTYIRALARDIGRKLGCGAYLKNLRRTKIGKYSIKDAYSLDEIEKVNIFEAKRFNESIH